jgi:hypothetical protein
MKSKHDALKEFSRAFNRYWRVEWCNAQRPKLCSDEKHDELYQKLDECFTTLIELKIDLSEIKIEIWELAYVGNSIPSRDWYTLSVDRQYAYFQKFPYRKDFWFLKNKQQ